MLGYDWSFTPFSVIIEYYSHGKGVQLNIHLVHQCFLHSCVEDEVVFLVCFRTSDDLTPLHIAASWGCFQNLRLLLRNGGNPNLKDQVKHSVH